MAERAQHASEAPPRGPRSKKPARAFVQEVSQCAEDEIAQTGPSEPIALPAPVPTPQAMHPTRLPIVPFPGKLPADVEDLIIGLTPFRARLMVLAFVCKRWRDAVLASVRELPHIPDRYRRHESLDLFPNLTALDWSRHFSLSAVHLPPTIRKLTLDLPKSTLIPIETLTSLTHLHAPFLLDLEPALRVLRCCPIRRLRIPHSRERTTAKSPADAVAAADQARTEAQTTGPDRLAQLIESTNRYLESLSAVVVQAQKDPILAALPPTCTHLRMTAQDFTLLTPASFHAPAVTKLSLDCPSELDLGLSRTLCSLTSLTTLRLERVEPRVSLAALAALASLTHLGLPDQDFAVTPELLAALARPSLRVSMTDRCREFPRLLAATERVHSLRLGPKSALLLLARPFPALRKISIRCSSSHLGHMSAPDTLGLIADLMDHLPHLVLLSAELLRAMNDPLTADAKDLAAVARLEAAVARASVRPTVLSVWLAALPHALSAPVKELARRYPWVHIVCDNGW